jgi:plasmid stabilization system protein ParE
MENDGVHTSILSSRADKELKSSFIWHEEQRHGLGDRFINEVINSIAKIERNPELAAIKHKSYRETRVGVFPYVVIYRIDKRKRIIRILSVFHTSQDPSKKYR